MSKKYKIGYTTDVYDMFHIGHLNILRRAKEQCETLIVGVTTDELCYKRKQKYPIINEKDRMAIVGAIRYVDKVVPQTDMEKIRPVKELGADAVFVGSDWKGTDAWKKYEKEFAEVGCMAVYHGDRPTDFVTAVESIYQQQTLKPNEIILVVDGPVSAEMNQAIDKLKRSIGCMKVTRFAENRGHAAARQTGIEAASNDVIALMDADDISLPDRFEKQIAFIEAHPGIAVLGGQINEFVTSTNNIVGRRMVPLSHKEIVAYIKNRCPFNQVTVILSRTQVLNAGGY